MPRFDPHPSPSRLITWYSCQVWYSVNIAGICPQHRFRYFVPDPILMHRLCEKSSLWLEDCMNVQPAELMHGLSLGLDQSRALREGTPQQASDGSGCKAQGHGRCIVPVQGIGPRPGHAHVRMRPCASCHHDSLCSPFLSVPLCPRVSHACAHSPMHAQCSIMQALPACKEAGGSALLPHVSPCPWSMRRRRWAAS